MVKPARTQLGAKVFTSLRTINLFVILHEEEWVEVKVAKKGDVGPGKNDYEGTSQPRIGHVAYSTRQ
jgi:hypothetical protein